MYAWDHSYVVSVIFLISAKVSFEGEVIGTGSKLHRAFSRPYENL